MLKIRLQRTGRKHEPTFRLVLTDSKNSTKSGRFLEVLGNHDFRLKQNTQIIKERVLHWMKQGAQVSDTVHNLLITHKILDAKKKNVLPKKTVEKKEEAPVATEATQAPSPEAPAQETPAEAPKAEEVSTS